MIIRVEVLRVGSRCPDFVSPVNSWVQDCFAADYSCWHGKVIMANKQDNISRCLLVCLSVCVRLRCLFFLCVTCLSVCLSASDYPCPFLVHLISSRYSLCLSVCITSFISFACVYIPAYRLYLSSHVPVFWCLAHSLCIHL